MSPLDSTFNTKVTSFRLRCRNQHISSTTQFFLKAVMMKRPIDYSFSVEFSGG